MQKREAEPNSNDNERMKIVEKGGHKISCILTKVDHFSCYDEPKCIFFVIKPYSQPIKSPPKNPL